MELRFRERLAGHFKTITHHKLLVMKYCFRAGLYRQGLLHDLSKYMPSEFFAGVKYYQGYRSPNNAQREAEGCSPAWLHHKGRNKHHFEYWQDYSLQGRQGMLTPVPMPDKYIAEMLMDRIAASKVYKGTEYTDAAPLEYYHKSREHPCIHPDTQAVLERMLTMLAREGERKTFARIKRELVKRK